MGPPPCFECGFPALKSEIEIVPVFHRLPNRIRTHALICFLALILYRVLRVRHKARDSGDHLLVALLNNRASSLMTLSIFNAH